MKTASQIMLQIIYFLLILLWIYAATSKLMDFGLFKAQMHRQVLFPFLKELLVYLLPPLEIIIAILLLFEVSQKIALYLSLIMLSIFTIYIGLAISNMFGKIPCSCGGVLTHLGWGTHFLFNIFFMLLTALGIYIVHRERRFQNPT